MEQQCDFKLLQFDIYNRMCHLALYVKFNLIFVRFDSKAVI